MIASAKEIKKDITAKDSNTSHCGFLPRMKNMYTVCIFFIEKGSKYELNEYVEHCNFYLMQCERNNSPAFGRRACLF